MKNKNRLTFLSLFVSNLDEAAKRYEDVFDIERLNADDIPLEKRPLFPNPHPFAPGEPVVFGFGDVAVALYQASPENGTHPGDIGIGIEASGGGEEISKRASQNLCRVFFGPKTISDDGRKMSVFVNPDRHFFEIVG